MKKALLIILFLGSLSLRAQTEDISCIYFQSKSPVAGQLCDAFKKLKEFHDYKEYSDDFIDDFNSGKEPRKPPSKLTGAGTMLSKLDKVLNDVNGIQIPTGITITNQSYPSASQLTSNNFEIRRNAINDAATYLVEYNLQLKELVSLKEDLEKFKAESNSVIKALEILKENLISTFQNTGAGYTELSNLFGFAALDIETKIKPKVSQVRNRLNDKISDLASLSSSEETKISNLQANTKILADGEREFLEKENQKLDSIQKGLNQKAEEFDQRSIENEKEGEELKPIEDQLIEEQKELQRIQDEIKRSIGRYNSDVRKLNSKEQNIKNMKYTGCPNREPFNKCDHTSQKNSYVKKRNAAVSDYNNFARRLEDRARSLKSKQDSFERKVNSWNSRYSSFETKAKTWQNEYEELIEIQQKIIQETQDFFIKKFKIGGFMEQNQIDSERISTLENYEFE